MQLLDAPDLPAASAGAYPTQAPAPAVAVQREFDTCSGLSGAVRFLFIGI
jgi:hypothetical protein